MKSTKGGRCGIERMGRPQVMAGAGVVMFAIGVALSFAAVAALAQQRKQPGVTGIGGVFFKVRNPQRVSAWYREHLGVHVGEAGADFLWRDYNNPESVGRTVWAPFPHDTDYFGPNAQDFMINYRVNDLDGLLSHLKAAGVQQADTLEEYSYGRFAWIVDVEGNRVELWEPPAREP